jgi:hypothetical protein
MPMLAHASHRRREHALHCGIAGQSLQPEHLVTARIMRRRGG